MKKNVWVATVISLALVGCATFSPQEQQALDYGPFPDDYERIIQDHLADHLKDPSSAQVEYRAGPQTITQAGSIISSKTYGWGLCLWINAKNSFGGYVGRRPYAYVIRNGEIIAAHGEMANNMFDSALAQGMCKQLGAR